MGEQETRNSLQPQKPKTPKSTIRWVHLDEKIGWAHGRYTVVSILKPSLRVERTPHHLARDPSRKRREAFYRIILSFRLQVDIAGFDAGGGYQACNRFFDNVSLRYLFTNGEDHTLTPRADHIQSALKVTNEETHSKSLDAGISGVTPTTIAPKVEAHINSEGKVVVEQEGQKSWRSGLSFEPYHRHHPHHHHPRHFTIKSQHGDLCNCDKIPSSHTCRLQDKSIVRYDKAAHWSWQARADIELWGQENYESMSRRITITRIVCTDEIDDRRKTDRIRPFLHFDFILESQLRELDHGWNGIKNPFRFLPKPPEVRRKADSGLPLEPDRVLFCMSPCSEMVYWPPSKTRNYEVEATKIAYGVLPSNDYTILGDDAYNKYIKEKEKEKKEKNEKNKQDGKDEHRRHCPGSSSSSSSRSCSPESREKRHCGCREGSCCPCCRCRERSAWGNRHHHHHHHHSISRPHSPRPQLEQTAPPRPSDDEELSSSEGSVVDVKASRRYDRVFINEQGIRPPERPSQPPGVIPIPPQNNHTEERPKHHRRHHHNHRHHHHHRSDSESRSPRRRSRDGSPAQAQSIHIRVRSTERMTDRSRSPPKVVRRVVTEPGPSRYYVGEERVVHVRELPRTRNSDRREQSPGVQVRERVMAGEERNHRKVKRVFEGGYS